MKKIKLTQDKYAIVDDDDYEMLSIYKWTYMGGGTNNYAYRKINRKTTRMHRIITNAPDGLDVDHINRDGLDNRKANLRIVNRSTNNLNCDIRKTNTSGYKGVSWCARVSKWRAYIGGSKTRVELGYYQHKHEAIKARAKAEKSYQCV